MLVTGTGLETPVTPPAVHAPEAICLLSRVAVFEALMECCRQLFRMRLQSAGGLAEAALEPLLTMRLPGKPVASMAIVSICGPPRSGPL